MQIFAFILDAHPPFLSGAVDGSLLDLPWGRDLNLLEAVRREAMSLQLSNVTVVARVESTVTRESSGGVPTISWEDFRLRVWQFEPSDWVLLIDPVAHAADGGGLGALISGLDGGPRAVRHLVALENHPGGTRECVETDSAGRVRRIQRYYDTLTWTFASSVLASLVPVSALRQIHFTAFGSLAELRTTLTLRGVPSHDVLVDGPTLDLTNEAHVLRVSQRLATSCAGTGPVLGPSTVHPSARILGPVVLQAGAIVAEDAMIVGPSLIGADARIGAGAVVVQCVVWPRAQVAAGASLHQRVVAFDPGPGEPQTGDVADTEWIPHLDDGPVGDAASRRIYRTIKTGVEISCAAAALLVLSPLLIALAILVWLDSRGPILYGDRREGLNGKPFRCYKFRTMRVGADRQQRELSGTNQVDGPQFKMNHDPRVTRLGRWLRPTSLDELPQLINVVLGQMSFVGPRPSPFRENQVCVPWREGRLSVRPGITGLWQVCRHDRAAGDFHQWIQYDLLYVRHMSASVDLKILLATIYTLGGRGHVPLEWIVRPAQLEVAA